MVWLSLNHANGGGGGGGAAGPPAAINGGGPLPHDARVADHSSQSGKNEMALKNSSQRSSRQRGLFSFPRRPLSLGRGISDSIPPASDLGNSQDSNNLSQSTRHHHTPLKHFYHHPRSHHRQFLNESTHTSPAIDQSMASTSQFSDGDEADGEPGSIIIYPSPPIGAHTLEPPTRTSSDAEPGPATRERTTSSSSKGKRKLEDEEEKSANEGHATFAQLTDPRGMYQKILARSYANDI